MSKAEVVTKLERLLARVRSRAADPRPGQGEPRRSAPEIRGTVSEADADVAVEEISQGGAAAPAETADSRERLIVAAPMAEVAPDAPLELDEPARLAPAGVAEATNAGGPPPDLELVLDEPMEEAPVSSRRPVVLESPQRLEDMAFGSEEPIPKHTPPPESGRLPAVPEPEGPRGEGAAAEDITGVREAASLSIPAISRAVSPEAIRPRLAPSEDVVEVLPAPAFSPATFVALLDASLKL